MGLDKKDGLSQALPETASSLLQDMAQAASLAAVGLKAAAQRRQMLEIQEKTAGDYVSEADVQAEETIAAYLQDRYPGYAWLGEETGNQQSKASQRRWIVDPLDGTTNFLKGIPHWAISIALYGRNTPIAAIVYDPSKEELFSAEKGQGAFLNARPIRVNQPVALQAALLATGVPSGGRSDYLPNCLEDLQALMPLTAGIRRSGAAALDLAYVAAGRFDAYWERNLGAWDIAAGVVLVEEAGGHVAPLWPDHTILSSGSFIAGEAALVDEIRTFLNAEQR